MEGFGDTNHSIYDNEEQFHREHNTSKQLIIPDFFKTKKMITAVGKEKFFHLQSHS